MRVAIIFLNYGGRTEYTEHARSALRHSGYHFDLYEMNIRGIAKAINTGIHDNPYYDAYAILANDIVMPPGWLMRMVEKAKQYGNTGLIGVHTVEALPPLDENGLHGTWCPFGNWLITKQVIEIIGYFNEAHDPYGMQDSDYGYRANKAGFYNYYLPGLEAKHIGHDVGNGTEYRAMKDEGLKVAGETYLKWVNHYSITGNLYLPYEQQHFNIY